ncbi:TPA: YaaC family protein [Bacillus cereus]
MNTLNEVNMVPIIFRNKIITPHKAVKSPNYGNKTVLVADPWEYVEMWLKRNCDSEDARFYWAQAKQFFETSKKLSLTAAPLPIFYSFLNAVKALLIVKGVPIEGRIGHGISIGKSKENLHSFSLENESVKIHKHGLLSELCKYLDETITEAKTYDLQSLFYNLPYIHRAYCLTFNDEKELFLPLVKPGFYRMTSGDIVFKGGLEATTLRTLRNKLNTTELDPRFHLYNITEEDAIKFSTAPEVYVLFHNSLGLKYSPSFEFTMNEAHVTRGLNGLLILHKMVRKHLHYIYGQSKLWYIKKSNNGSKRIINRSTLTIAYSAMHRLSELARYEPMLLSKHLESEHNWLLSEFIRIAPHQFIDELASELTGEEFMAPGYAKER